MNYCDPRLCAGIEVSTDFSAEEGLILSPLLQTANPEKGLLS